jgi:RNA polymerase sigma-70 factor (ECF subfamily)
MSDTEIAALVSGTGQPAVRARTLDPESAEWVTSLALQGAAGEAAARRLHDLLLRVARSEMRRRRAGAPATEWNELDLLAGDAATDALVAIRAKLGEFRGESRFTTWAYRFVVLEVAGQLGRSWRRRHGVHLDEEQWEQLPDRFGLDPARQAEWRELVDALREAVEHDLTERQRRVFSALVLNGVPLDALAAELGSTRNAIYKTLFDARRKLRASLAANGFMTQDEDADGE